jgi:hypothetical protein
MARNESDEMGVLLAPRYWLLVGEVATSVQLAAVHPARSCR